MYRELVDRIERHWEGMFGKEKIHRLREFLEQLMAARSGDRPLLSEDWCPQKAPSGRANKRPRSVAAMWNRRASECAIWLSSHSPARGRRVTTAR
jgi:hypothetical protein